MATKIKLLPVTAKLTEDASRPILTLFNSKEAKELILGRNDDFGITEKRCSREHLTIKYDEVSEEIMFKQSGSNPSSVQYGDTSHVLAKHDVKRIPISQCLSQDKPCIIFLIHKDSLYGYKVVAKVSKPAEANKTSTVHINSKPVDDKTKYAASSSKMSTNGTETKKRKTGTLDEYVKKKAKTEHDSPSTCGSELGGKFDYSSTLTVLV